MKDVEVELSGCKDCFGAKETAWQPLFGSLKAFQGTCQFTTMVADTAQSWRGRQGSGFGTKCWWLMTSQTTFQERIYRILESRNPALPLDLQTLLALQLQKPLAMVSTEKKKTSDIWHIISTRRVHLRIWPHWSCSDVAFGSWHIQNDTAATMQMQASASWKPTPQIPGLSDSFLSNKLVKHQRINWILMMPIQSRIDTTLLHYVYLLDTCSMHVYVSYMV